MTPPRAAEKSADARSAALQRGLRNRSVKRADAHLETLDPGDPVDAVRALIEKLPSLDDVREVDEVDDSPLTPTERTQRAAAEGAITTAQAAGKAAVWVIGRALDVIARGRLHRDSGLTYEEYVSAALGISAPHARRWRAGAPVAAAIEAAPVGKRVGPPPESHIRELPTDPELAAPLYEAVVEVAEGAGEKVTARLIKQARRRMPRGGAPADPVERSAVLRTAAREALAEVTPSAPIGAPDDEGEIVDAEIVEEHPETAPGWRRLAADMRDLYDRAGSDELAAEYAADPGPAAELARDFVQFANRAAYRGRRITGGGTDQ